MRSRLAWAGRREGERSTMRAEHREKRKTAIEMGGLCEGRFEGMGIGVERNKGSGGGWVEENAVHVISDGKRWENIEDQYRC